MQVITIAGRIGRDAELRSTQSGDQVCNFSVAVETRNGREKVTNWWRVSLWGRRGEALNQYLTKGAAVTVVGEFGLSEYDGKPQLNVRASEVALQGGQQQEGRQSNRGEDRRERGEPRGRSQSGQSGGGFGGYGDDLDDEIPF